MDNPALKQDRDLQNDEPSHEFQCEKAAPSDVQKNKSTKLKSALTDIHSRYGDMLKRLAK